MEDNIRRYLSRLGKKGGSSKSKVKVAAVIENLEAAWKARRKYTPCDRYNNRSHRFSPKTGRCACGYYKPGSKPKGKAKKSAKQQVLPLQ